MTDRPNVVLTGIMGSGKSTVAPLVAERLGYELVDTDAVIVERYGPIEVIWRGQGEPYFRTLEYEVASELSGTEGKVISTGGGLMLEPDAREALDAHGTRVFWLAAEPAELVRRVTAQGGTRPLLLGGDPIQTLERLLLKRELVYGRYRRVDTGGRTPEQVADEIAEAVRTPDAGTPDAPS